MMKKKMTKKKMNLLMNKMMKKKMTKKKMNLLKHNLRLPVSVKVLASNKLQLVMKKIPVREKFMNMLRICKQSLMNIRKLLRIYVISFMKLTSLMLNFCIQTVYLGNLL